MMRILRMALIALLIAAAALFIGDLAVFELRGAPTRKITVSLFVSAPLKNNKQQLDYLGQEDWSCARALFPQNLFSSQRISPCWYLEKHTNQVTTY